MLVLSKFEDHLYYIPVAAYIMYEILYTVLCMWRLCPSFTI